MQEAAPNVVELLFETVSVLKGIVPITPPKVTAPVPASTVRVSLEPPVVPLVVPVIVTAPPPEVSVGVAPSAITKSPPNDPIAIVFEVVMSAARLTSPVEEKPPFALMVPLEVFVSKPEFVTVTELTLKAAFRVKIDPVSVTGPPETVPLKVVVPCPSDCVKDAAETKALAVTLFALAMVIAPKVVAPTFALKRIFPSLPALTVTSFKSPRLESASVNVMSLPPILPPELVVSMVALLEKTTFEKETDFPAVRILAFRLDLDDPPVPS